MKIKSGYKIREIAGEQVIIKAGKFGTDLTRLVALNPTAVWLYEQLSGKRFSLADVANLLMERFEVDAPTAQADAAKWVTSLKDAELLAD